jgi:hypothetical protein
MVFGNPLGWWALLGIPAVLLIHFLQQESRQVRVSTLFLLEALAPRSVGGRRFEQLRNSVPLWMQLLAVLLLTWLLIEPRWIRPDSSQRIVVLLDSSVSMQAFRGPAIAALTPHLRELSKSASHTDWILMETDPAQPTLYSGRDAGLMLEAIERWKPRLGTHDPAPAFRVAQALPAGRGAAVFVTDHPIEPPAGIEVVAVGQPTSNVGFAGLRVEKPGADNPAWQAIVRNYGTVPETRVWKLLVQGREISQETLNLAAGQARVIRGTFPEGANAVELTLNHDALAIDDRLPIVRPVPKALGVAFDPKSPLAELFGKIVRSLSGVRVVEAGAADFQLLAVEPASGGQAAEVPAVVFVTDSLSPKEYLEGPIITERSSLMDDLSWQGLIAQDTYRVATRPDDQVLLWQGGRPLIFSRTLDSGAPQLFINFDVTRSNAGRLPALVLLIHRFAERLRASKVAPESRNVDTWQAIEVAHRVPIKEYPVHFLTGSPESEILAEGATPIEPIGLRAPAEPIFFEIRQDKVPLLRAAAQFGDGREADLTQAGQADTLAGKSFEQALRNSESDPFGPLIVLALLGVLLFSWAWLGGLIHRTGNL